MPAKGESAPVLPLPLPPGLLGMAGLGPREKSFLSKEQGENTRKPGKHSALLCSAISAIYYQIFVKSRIRERRGLF